MKRLIGVFMAAAALVNAAGVPATARPSPRVETQSYELGGQVGASVLGPIVAQAVFPGGPQRFAEFEIEDASGQPVLAEIVQDDHVDTFCGATAEPVPLRPGFDVTIHLFAGRCVDGTPSVIAGGAITATFLPVKAVAGASDALARPYSMLAPGPFFGFDPPLPGNLVIGNVRLPVGPFRTLEVSLDDAGGGSVAAVVEQDGNEIGRFCSQTDKPLDIRPWTAVDIYLHVGACEDGSVSSPTTGVIDARFSR